MSLRFHCGQCFMQYGVQPVDPAKLCPDCASTECPICFSAFKTIYKPQAPSTKKPNKATGPKTTPEIIQPHQIESCGHIFCYNCIATWTTEWRPWNDRIKNYNRCPICRTCLFYKHAHKHGEHQHGQPQQDRHHNGRLQHCRHQQDRHQHGQQQHDIRAVQRQRENAEEILESMEDLNSRIDALRGEFHFDNLQELRQNARVRAGRQMARNPMFKHDLWIHWAIGGMALAMLVPCCFLFVFRLMRK